MKKIYILFYLLIYLGESQAQIATIFPDVYTDTSQIRIGVAADGFANANALTADFISKFYRGGYIDVALKDKVLARTKNSNRVGAELNSGIFAAFRLDSFCHRAGFNLFFSVRDRQHFDMHYRKDFYKVGFYGNKAYAGRVANFADFSLNLIRYQQLQIGLFCSQLDSNTRWGISLSLLKGEQYRSILAKKTELFTSADGQYLTFQAQMEMGESDPAHKGLSSMNGLGVSMDIYFQAPLQTKLGEAKIEASISDIGMIRFNESSLYRKQDSVFRYDGLRINSIFDIQDSTFLKTSQDSILNNILPPSKRSVTATLPSTFNLSMQTKLSEHFYLTEGIHYIFNANYKLLAYIKGDIHFNKRFMISVTAGYGGYAEFNCGIGLALNAGKGYSFYAGTNNLEGFVVPSKVAGRAAYFSIIKNFN
ncbi:MAG TPA: DUF5723 family protein [Bacteroidia bacterium]|nr:DUF5723 family protein [Bacteroidia bacterium]HRG51858.1 DUF5723 family protein [Bacteroidia bacterium]